MSVKLTVDGIQFPGGSVQERSSVYSGEERFFNCCLYFNGVHQAYSHIGGTGTWSVPADTQVITFHAWGGGGSGAGHCCHGCYCDMVSCGSFGGYYARKTIRKCDGDFTDGDTYTWCYGAGGNGMGPSGNGTDICWNACCDAPRGCASYVNGPGLSNFCAVGGRGGYNLYCSCRCNNQANRQESETCLGMIPGVNVDFASVGGEPNFTKSRGNCDCNSRSSSTSKSYGIDNQHTYNIENSMAYCGCAACCTGFKLIAQGGASHMKSYCGNWNCYCHGTPGNPGMVVIEWA